MIWVILGLRYSVLVLLYVFLIWAGVSIVREHSQERKPQHQGASLAVLSSGSAQLTPGQRWEIGRGLTIGRGDGCAIQLRDPFVSSQHTRIYQLHGEYYVEDLKSTNGTILNGKPLHQPTRLQPGEKLQIGEMTFTINAGRASKKGHSLLLEWFPGFFLAAGGGTLYFNNFLKIQELTLLLVVALFLVISSLIFHYVGQGDSFFFMVIGVLTALGLIFLYRINPFYGIRQSYWVIIGFTVFWLTQFFLRHYKRLLDFKYLIMALSILFLVLTIFVGTEAGGARSWLALGSFRFQPSELVKVFMVIFLAAYLDENRDMLTQGTVRIGRFLVPDWRYLVPLFLTCGLSLVLLVFQKDLGMALLFFSIFISMVYAATGRSSYLVTGMALFLVGAFIMYLIFPHVQERIAVFIDPWRLANSGGYQVVQSLFALSGGGIWGWGLGGGFPQLIPAVHTDFIFPLIGEELGLAGSIGILILYGFLIWQGMQVALQRPDGFGRLLAFGFSSLLALQALIILGGVANVIPLTGIPLPFLSYGGSSFVSNCFLVGILMKISEGKADELTGGDLP